jgi:hypothetical protein
MRHEQSSLKDILLACRKIEAIVAATTEGASSAFSVVRSLRDATQQQQDFFRAATGRERSTIIVKMLWSALSRCAVAANHRGATHAYEMRQSTTSPHSALTSSNILATEFSETESDGEASTPLHHALDIRIAR